MKIKIEVQRTIGKTDNFFITIYLKCCGVMVREVDWPYKGQRLETH